MSGGQRSEMQTAAVFLSQNGEHFNGSLPYAGTDALHEGNRGTLDALCKYRKRRQEHTFLPPRFLLPLLISG